MQTCKFCLSSTEGKEYSDLDDDVLKRLEFLQIDLAHNDEESNFLCSQCDEKIENIFDFKLCVVINTTNMKNMPRQSTVEAANESIKCHLCKNYGDQQIMISLTKLLKDDDRMMEVFQGHLQEMDLENVEDSMVCEVCQKSLVIFWSLIESWSKSRNLSDDDMTDNDDDDFECVALKKENLENDGISDSNDDGKRATENGNCKKRQLSSGDNSSDSDNSIKMELNEILDSSGGACLSTDDVKKEEIEEIDNQQLKVEEVEIKDEYKLLEDHVNHRMELDVKVHKKIHDLEEYKCKNGSFETKYKTGSKVPLLKRKSLNEIQMYKCQECSYKTKRKSDLTKHLLVHKNVDEVQMFKCKECSYETKYKQNLKIHLLTHKSLDEIQMYKCNECSFETSYKQHLKRHMLKHRSLNKILYKCKECSYETKYKLPLKTHLLTHESLDEIQMYKCKECAFETKYKGHLRKHMLKHGSLNKIQIYKCKECSYVSPYKTHLKPHLLKHKSLDEIQIYK